MKKFLFVLVCVFAVLQLSAQQPNIVNPGFEQWSGGYPVGWTTKVSGTVYQTIFGYDVTIYNGNLNFGSQTSDAHSGSSALMLKADGINVSSYSFTLPGIAQLGTAGSFRVSLATIQQLAGLDFSNIDLSNLPDIDWEDLASLRNILSPGAPFNVVPSAMKVWVKYLPPEGVTDTMLILVGAYKTGEPNMLLMGDLPTAYGYYAGNERIQDYTQLTVPITYDVEDLDCDSLMIMFVSSSFRNANRLTELYVDDITFEYDYVSVESTERVKMNLYPNPASDYMTISLDNQSDLYDATVYDVNGRQIKKLERLTGDTRMSVDDLSAGAYFLKVQQAGNTTVRKFVVE